MFYGFGCVSCRLSFGDKHSKRERKQGWKRRREGIFLFLETARFKWLPSQWKCSNSLSCGIRNNFSPPLDLQKKNSSLIHSFLQRRRVKQWVCRTSNRKKSSATVCSSLSRIKWIYFWSTWSRKSIPIPHRKSWLTTIPFSWHSSGPCWSSMSSLLFIL